MSNRHVPPTSTLASDSRNVALDLRSLRLGGPTGPTPGHSDPTRETTAAERPWGDFEQLVSNEQVTVKIITVQPGHRLSLQRHEHRGEMWKILDEPIDVTLEDRRWSALPGETVWVPCGAVHRMGNSTRVAARVLEVAFGPFDEADIHRLADDYAR